MTQIEVKSYQKHADDLVGVKIITYDSLGRELDTVTAIADDDYNRLINFLDNHAHDYVSIETINSEVRPSVETLLTQCAQNQRFPTFYLDNDGNLYMMYVIGE